MRAEQMFQESIDNKEEFWKKQAEEITWMKFPETILSQDENNYPQWFADGETNMSYLCID